MRPGLRKQDRASLRSGGMSGRFWPEWGGFKTLKLRHAELVSASIQRPNPLFDVEK